MISSYELARNVDVVYSEVISPDEFDKLKKRNLQILKKEKNRIFYISKKLEISKNSTIFTHTDHITSLLKLLDNIPLDFSINLITHQSDIPITKKLYDSRPSCINKWYGVNIDYLDKDLIPIPLGLANKFSSKNIQLTELDKFKNKTNKFKQNLLYINFQINTNKEERLSLYKFFENKNWVKIDFPNLKKEEYIENILNSHFILCPWGNGFDTHRIWESLLLGSVPIIKKHNTFNYLNNLPVLFVDNYEEINEELLIDFKNKLKNNKFSYDKLSKEYWINLIKSDVGEIRESILLKSKTNKIFLFTKVNNFILNFVKFPYYFINSIKKNIKKYISNEK